MRQVQRTEPSIALERQFGLRGHIGIGLDEVAVPVVDIGDFAGKSPYEEGRWLGGDWQTSAAGGVGIHSGVLITPAPGTILVVESIYVRNNSGGAQPVELQVFTPASVAAVTIVGTSACPRWDGVITPGGLAPRLACTSRTYTHTDMLAGATTGIMSLGNNAVLPFQLPRGIVLDGSDPAGPISIAAQNATANQGVTVGYAASEYRLGG